MSNNSINSVLTEASSSLAAGGLELEATKRKALEELLDHYEEAYQLEQIVKLAFSDADAAWSALKGRKFKGGFVYLESAVSSLICSFMADGRHREEHIRKEFYENLSSYVPGAEVAAVPIFKGNIPDGFISVNGRTSPVEIKRHAFDGAALAQISRYMSAYNSDIGYAVAPKLTCELPSNIYFIQVLPPSTSVGQ